MKQLIIFLIIAISLSACQTIRLGTEPIGQDGFKIISLPSLNAQIDYYGDYKFHDFHKKYFPTAAPAFLEYIKKEHRNPNNKMLLAAHTSILPYFSTVAIHYGKGKNEVRSAESIKKELRSVLNASNVELTDVATTVTSFKRLTYSINHPLLNTQTRHVDYIGNINEETIRIYFWTSDSNTKSMIRESEKIIERLKVID